MDFLEDIFKFILEIIAYILIEFLFITIICDLIGRYTRYLFLRLVGKNVNIESLSNTDKKGITNLSNSFFNFMTAMLLFASFFFLYVWTNK